MAKAKAVKLAVKFKGSATMNYDLHRSSITIAMERQGDVNPIVELLAGGMLEATCTANPSKTKDVDDRSGKQQVMKDGDITVTIPCKCPNVRIGASEVFANLKYDTVDVDMDLAQKLYGRDGTVKIVRIGDCGADADEDE